ncbi:MAG: hypothetical protein ABL915_10345, partial [Gallionella sp.]
MNTLLKAIFILLIGLAISWQAGAAEPVTEAQCAALQTRLYENKSHYTRKYTELEERLNAEKKAAILNSNNELRIIYEKRLLALMLTPEVLAAHGAEEFEEDLESRQLQVQTMLCWSDFGAQRPDSFNYTALVKKMRNASQLLNQSLSRSVGQEAAVLTKFIEQNSKDADSLLLAAVNQHATPEQLELLSSKDDMALNIAIVWNTGCSADTLAKIYRTHANQDFPAADGIAGNKHTPPDILRDIFMKKTGSNPNSGFMGLLAGNASTPSDIYQQLSDSQDEHVLFSVLVNPKLDCAILQRVNQTVSVKYPDSNT